MANKLTTVPKGRRVMVLYASYDTQVMLREWAKNAGFDLGWSYSGWPQQNYDFDFHITLLATSNKVELEPSVRWVNPVTVDPTGYLVLGEDESVPVLKLADNPALSAMREFFIKTFAAAPTFETFLPHVSLSYHWEGEPPLNALMLPPGPLVFDRLVVAELSDKPVNDAAPKERTAMFMTDKASVSSTRMTSDGYLLADCRVARTGIQEYLGSEVGIGAADQVIRVYRPPEEVFKRDSLASYAFRPVTVDHPPHLVTPDTWKRDAVGSVGGDVVRDGGFVRVPMLIMDKAAIDAVKSGKREISMGYDCRLEIGDGVTPEGEPYNAIQRDIRINHCAIVDAGRAGPLCRVGDRVSKDQPKKENTAMKTVTVDGRKIEVADDVAEIITALQGKVASTDTTMGAMIADLQKHLPNATALIADLKAQVAAKDKEIADAAAKIADTEKKILSAADIAKIAADRSALTDAGKKIAADVEIGDKSPADFRRAVVAKKLGDAAVKDRGDEYVSAQFDMLASVTSDAATDPVRDAMKAGANGATGVTDARKAYQDNLSTAWSK